MILSDFLMPGKDKFVKKELSLLNIDIFYFIALYLYLYFLLLILLIIKTNKFFYYHLNIILKYFMN